MDFAPKTCWDAYSLGKDIENCEIINDSALKQTIQMASIPTKTVTLLSNFVDMLSKGVSVATELTMVPLQSYLEQVCTFSLLSRPSSVSLESNNGEVSLWSTPILDLNFAYRICLEITRNTLIPPPSDDCDFYSRGKILQNKIDDFAQSYIQNEWSYQKLGQIANLEEMVEYMYYFKK